MKIQVETFYGRIIHDAVIMDDKLILSFEGNDKIYIWDNAQCCCEHRHMSSDDDIKSLKGQKLQRVEVKDGSDLSEGDDCHDIQFLEIGGDKGFVTIVNHNEHNGYYGGFSIIVTDKVL